MHRERNILGQDILQMGKPTPPPYPLKKYIFLITPAGRTGHPGATIEVQEHSRRVPLGMLHTQPQVCSREWGSAAALPRSLQLPSPSGKGAARAAAERDRNYS